jgi:hypothetical protein
MSESITEVRFDEVCGMGRKGVVVAELYLFDGDRVVFVYDGDYTHLEECCEGVGRLKTSSCCQGRRA